MTLWSMLSNWVWDWFFLGLDLLFIWVSVDDKLDSFINVDFIDLVWITLTHQSKELTDWLHYILFQSLIDRNVILENYLVKVIKLFQYFLYLLMIEDNLLKLIQKVFFLHALGIELSHMIHYHWKKVDEIIVESF